MASIMVVYFVIFSLLALAVLVRSDTNADRFRRGLPPLRPASLLDNSGALRERIRRDNFPSCAPISSTHGIIKIQTPSGGFVGYIGNTYDDANGNELATLPEDALEVDLPTSLSAPFFISESSPPESTLPYLAACAGPENSYLAAGSPGYAFFTASSYVPPNSPPSGASYQVNKEPAETTIWSMSCLFQLSMIWTNTDTTQCPGTFFYDSSEDLIGVTGDWSTFESTYGGGISLSQVNFVFVPL